jgi:hypothetical protein
MFRVLAVLGLTLCLQAEFIESWSLVQNDFEVSWSWCDLNQDGVEELIKDGGNSVSFYDGADGFSLTWRVADPSPCDSCSFTLLQQKDETFVFVHQNVYEQTAKIHIYDAHATAPSWSSNELPGNVSYASLEKITGQNELNLIYSWHAYDDEQYSSGWALHTLSGDLLASVQSDGYLVGPFVANLEGDEGLECLFNWYYANGTSRLQCFSWTGTAVAEADQPADFALRAYPNPFNPVCRLDLRVEAGVHSVQIYSIDGRLVRELPLHAIPGQRVQIIWDGLNQRGLPLASGIYIAQSGASSLPITLAK